MSQIIRESRYQDFLRHLAEGRLTGTKIINQFGQNQDIGDTSKETLMYSGGLYHWMDTAYNLEISSDSSDDSVGGIGAQKVTIEGLDSDCALLTEVVDMDGTNTVTTTNQFFRVIDLKLTQAGSNETNVGTLTATDGSNTIETIPPDQGKSHTATYTIPCNYTGIILGWHGAERSKQGVTIEFWRRDINDNVFFIDRETVLYGTEFERNFVIPIPVAGETDLELRAISAQSGGFATGGFNGYIIHDDVAKIY